MKCMAPFSSTRLRSSVTVSFPEDENIVRVFCKGAPEIILKQCDNYIGLNGETE
jgi:magnesium-transporting ATPase (P-type)